MENHGVLQLAPVRKNIKIYKVMWNCQFSFKLVHIWIAYTDYIADCCDHISPIYVEALLRYGHYCLVVCYWSLVYNTVITNKIISFCGSLTYLSPYVFLSIAIYMLLMHLKCVNISCPSHILSEVVILIIQDQFPDFNWNNRLLIFCSSIWYKTSKYT